MLWKPEPITVSDLRLPSHPEASLSSLSWLFFHGELRYQSLKLFLHGIDSRYEILNLSISFFFSLLRQELPVQDLRLVKGIPIDSHPRTISCFLKGHLDTEYIPHRSEMHVAEFFKLTTLANGAAQPGDD
jgi:hypothetical protein